MRVLYRHGDLNYKANAKLSKGYRPKVVIGSYANALLNVENRVVLQTNSLLFKTKMKLFFHLASFV